MSGLSDGGHVEQLACVVLNSAEHHHSDGVALLLDHLQDVLCSESLFALTRQEADCVTRYLLTDPKLVVLCT